MHYLLKRKILQFVFKYFFYIVPTRFGTIGPSSGSTYQNLTKVTKMRHATTILTKCFNWYFKETVILVTLARFWYVLSEDGPMGPKHVGAM
jgi:hypothetical protein